MNIFSILQESAIKWPNRMAIIHDDEHLDYATLEKKANELRDQLKEFGVGPGNALAILFPNGIDFIISLMGAVGTGSLVMPIFHQQKEKEIKEALEEGQMHFVLSGEALSKKGNVLNFLGKIIIRNSPYYLYSTQRKREDKTGDFIDHPAFMRFTSGTTGNAKGVIISHQSVNQRISSANEALELNEKDSVLWVLPMAFHFVVSIVLFLKYGVTIIVDNSFSADDFVKNMTTNKVTFFYGSPMHIKLLAGYKKSQPLKDLSKVVSTTTAISAKLCNQFFEKYGIPVSQAYGIIEIGLPIINSKKSEENPEAVGYCLPAYTVGILDEDLNELGVEETGLLGIKGPGMFAAYLKPKRLRAEVLENGWFMTGDLAQRDANGLITIKGRKKNVINVSGNKVFPIEVEEIINSFNGVVKCKAYAKKHILLGEVVALDVIVESGYKGDKEELINFTRQHLSDYKVPQIVNFVNDIEMTASGKIKR